MRHALTILILTVLLAGTASAQQTAIVERVVVQFANTVELDSAALAIGHVVVNEDNWHDVRVGDGVTAGGRRIYYDGWATNNMLEVWGGIKRVDVEAMLAFSIGQLQADPETDPVFAAWLATDPLDDFLTEYTETDPVHAAWLLTDPLAGMLTEEVDPVYAAEGIRRVDAEALLALSMGDPRTLGIAATWANHAATGPVNMGGYSLTNAANVTATNFGHADTPNAIRINSTGGVGIGATPGASGLTVAGPFVRPANTTNFYIRPDGGTNTIEFLEGGAMVINTGPVGGSAVALTINTNGHIGVRGLRPDSNYAIYAPSIYTYGSVRGSRLQDATSVQYYVDPFNAAGPSAVLNSSVGIGTTPAEMLDVNGNAVVRTNLYLGGTNSWLWSNGTNLFFSTSVGAGVTNQITSN
jgi:hypothetical protein